jgi:phosphatidylinositol 3-kinase
MRVRLDLKLTPYSVLATSTQTGVMEFVTGSHAVSGISDFKEFFRKHNPNSTAPLGIDPEVIDTFVKSCAGYSVVTYLLGIGDRHLDNIMLKVRR